MLELGRGRFARVVATEDEQLAVKLIDIDDQKPPHDWRAEVAALQTLRNATHVIHMVRWSLNRKSIDPQLSIEMPRYSLTLEHIIYHYAKAKYPPGSGWRNTMPVQRIVDIIGGIASGLSAVHAQGIIHRDIKPENVLFHAPDAKPVLIDFGIAWVPGVSESTEPVGDRITDVSSAEYKAPELLFGIRRYTEKVDLWALGCIVGRLLSYDASPLFAPYTSDMALIAAQVRALGAPDAKECPSFAGSVAEHMPASSRSDEHDSSEARPLLRLFRSVEGGDLLKQIATSLLDYEWTKRPSATHVVKKLEKDFSI